MNRAQNYTNQQQFPADKQTQLIVSDMGLFLNVSEEKVFLNQRRATDSNSVR